MADNEGTSESINCSGELVARPPIHPHSFSSLNPCRFDEIFLYYDHNKKGQHRYCLTVVDRPVLPSTQLSFSTAAFLIPAGRESEYMFSNVGGLQSIAKSAKCARLIAVSFGRYHTFQDQSAVQEELTYVVQILSQQGSFLTASLRKKLGDTTIPFLAMDGIGKRDILAECETKFSGSCLVEQVEAHGSVVRRLYFVNNPFVIQSEAILSRDLSVDKSMLAFEYHKHMAAGILSLCDLYLFNQAPEASECSQPSGIVIGLGGGGLVTFLQHVLPSIELAVVELDPSIVDVAKKYFGFEETDCASVRVGDGLSVGSIDDVETKDSESPHDAILFPTQTASFIAIDVDSKDKVRSSRISLVLTATN